MKKVTVFVGSARKKNTYKAGEQFVSDLKALGNIEAEIVVLHNYRLGFCKGCMLCFERGEEFCPLKDDRDVLFDKIIASDGVVFATPNYSFDLSGITKAFMDRFGFIMHRPRFFGKTFTSIVTQGIGRGNEIVKLLDFFAMCQGFNTVKGACLTYLNPTEKEQQKCSKAIAALSQRFYAQLEKPAYPVPSLLMLMGFRMGRNAVHEKSAPDSRDYAYYTEKGWFESDYFYPTQLPPLKKAAGMLFDRTAAMIRSMIGSA